MIKDIEKLEKFSKIVRRDILDMVHGAKSGHIGGSLSSVEILNVLYNCILNVPVDWDKNENFNKRDIFILSKGHASPALYSTLANKGFFDRNMLSTFRKLDSKLQGHPSKIFDVPGIETSTGSLGQGFSIGVGVALGLRLNNIKSHVFVLIGDGELQEGSCWESFMNANHKKLDNIVAIVDRNNLQIDGKTEDVKSIEPLDLKFKSFGFEVETIDGHNFNEIYEALLNAKNSNKPYCIIANTIKGKGVSFMENNAGWHGKAPNDEEYNRAIGELQNA